MRCGRARIFGMLAGGAAGGRAARCQRFLGRWRVGGGHPARDRSSSAIPYAARAASGDNENALTWPGLPMLGSIGGGTCSSGSRQQLVLACRRAGGAIRAWRVSGVRHRLSCRDAAVVVRPNRHIREDWPEPRLPDSRFCGWPGCSHGDGRCRGRPASSSCCRSRTMFRTVAVLGLGPVTGRPRRSVDGAALAESPRLPHPQGCSHSAGLATMPAVPPRSRCVPTAEERLRVHCLHVRHLTSPDWRQVP